MKTYSMKETGTYRFDPPFEVLIDESSLDPFDGIVIARIEEDELLLIGEGLDLEMAIRDVAKKLNYLAAKQRFGYRVTQK